MEAGDINLEGEAKQKPSTSKGDAGILFLTIIQLIENLHVLGMSNLTIWDMVTSSLKTRTEILTDPLLFQIFTSFKYLYDILNDYIYTDPNVNQKTAEQLAFREFELEELLEIFPPEIEKSTFKDKLFSFDHVLKFNELVKKILSLEQDYVESFEVLQKPMWVVDEESEDSEEDDYIAKLFTKKIQ